MINQENIYQLLQKENWTELMSILFRNKASIKSDEILKYALDTIINTMVVKATELNTETVFIQNLKDLILLNVGKDITLDSKQIESIYTAISNASEKNLPLAYYYAKDFPNNTITKNIIEQYHKEYPIEISTTLEDKIDTKVNSVDKNIKDARKSMFNSYQETEFFIAMKRVFDTYQVYPNVAISNIINFDLIKDELSQKEINFFFKTSVDFTVFEPFKNYIPIYFFEIDSAYHDAKEQIEKDKMKDKIFSIAGQKLYRIRKRDKQVGEMEFEKIVREIRDLTE